MNDKRLAGGLRTGHWMAGGMDRTRSDTRITEAAPHLQRARRVAEPMVSESRATGSGNRRRLTANAKIGQVRKMVTPDSTAAQRCAR